MFNVMHQFHKSAFLVCKNDGNEADCDCDVVNRVCVCVSVCACGEVPVAVCVWATGWMRSMPRPGWCLFLLCRGNATFVMTWVIHLHSRITPGNGWNGQSFSSSS